MPALLVLLLILALLVPGLAATLLFAFLMLLPAYVMVSSLLTVVLAPQQMLAVASDRRTRRNHSCEHATVNVLEEWFGPLPQAAGVATKEGFYVWGVDGIDPDTLIGAAQQGLGRMKRGERNLALHPRCGTSMTVAQFVFALVFLLTLGLTGYFFLEAILVALAAMFLLGKPLGLLAQKYFTTSPDVATLDIAEMFWTPRPRLGGTGLFFLPRGAFFFRTVQ